VERHEHFEALCAAASIGQASGAELAELQEHLGGCTGCQQAYADFLQLGAVRAVADANNTQEITGPEAIGYIDSAQFREKFLKKAEAEGILLSGERIGPTFPDPRSAGVKPQGYTTFALGIAASILLALVVVGAYRGKFYPNADKSLSQKTADAPRPVPAASTPVDPSRDALIERLENEKRQLTAEIASLRASLAKQSDSIHQVEATAAASEKDRAALLSAERERDAKIDELQHQLSQAQTEVVSVQTELEKAQAANQATVLADQTRIRELTEQLAEQSSVLDREREMLAANRDIRDLMSARNLHIADVFDTDPKGKTRAAFGRVFFTEGKSLIIYAYDLHDHRVQDAGYHYRVWGKKEGPGQSAKSLGIFFSDDKTQKRWVFKYDDPKVLSEIDSVFVTLEPPGKNPTEPNGEKFLYAYLRNQPNHP
jgi:hypothetical protein